MVLGNDNYNNDNDNNDNDMNHNNDIHMISINIRMPGHAPANRRRNQDFRGKETAD